MWRGADRQTVSAASLRVSNEREKCGVDRVCMTPSAGVRVFICNEYGCVDEKQIYFSICVCEFERVSADSQ